MDLFGSLGNAGLAGTLSVLLWWGTAENAKGKAKALGWGWIVFFSLMAGVMFASAGPVFNWIPGLVKDVFDIWKESVPGYTGAGIALTLVALAFFAPMSRRQTAMTWIALAYAFSDAGKLSIIVKFVGTIAHRIAG